MSEGSQDARVLEELFQVICERMGSDPGSSHTARLFAKGRAKIAQKVGEEAVETAIAAVAGGDGELAAESADLLYHLLVCWADAGLDPQEVWAELERRKGTSGLAEKAARKEQ